MHNNDLVLVVLTFLKCHLLRLRQADKWMQVKVRVTEINIENWVKWVPVSRVEKRRILGLEEDPPVSKKGGGTHKKRLVVGYYRGFESWSSQSNNFKTDTCRFLDWRYALLG